MKKLLPLLALLIFFESKAQTFKKTDPETGQPIIEDCPPINKTSTTPRASNNPLSIYTCCNIPVTATDVYAENAGITSAEKQMVREFVESCRPFLNKFYAIYFFLGGKFYAHKVNFMNPFDNEYAFSLQFPNKATHDEEGVFFDGAKAQFANTQIMPALMVDANVGASYYLLNSIPGGTIISNGTGTFSIWKRDNDGKAYGYIAGSTAGAPVPDTRGFGTIQRNGNTIEVFNAGTLAAVINPAALDNFTSELPIKLSQNYANPQSNSLRWAFAAIHQTLTAAEQTTLYNAVELIQVKKGRDIPQ